MVTPLLAFVAEDVGTDTVEYTPESIVHTIFFGIGDPEADGHAWNFSRCFDDDWGVCTVREIRAATIYDGIVSFNLHRSGLECVFHQASAEEVGFTELRITFAIDDQTWNEVASAAKVVFRDRPCFHLK